VRLVRPTGQGTSAEAGDRRLRLLRPGQPLTQEDFETWLWLNPYEMALEDDQPRTWLVQVHPKLPPYRLDIVPRAVTWDEWGLARRRDRSTVYLGRIEISRLDSPGIVQTLHVRGGAQPTALIRNIAATDVNLDGYLDIAAFEKFGAARGQAVYWLFEPRSGRFARNALARRLSGLTRNRGELCAEDGEIRVRRWDGPCGGPDDYAYNIVGGRLVLMEAYEFVQSRSRGGRGSLPRDCVVVKKKRVGGRLVVQTLP